MEAEGADTLDLETLDPEQCALAWILFLDADVDREELTEVFTWVEDECELSIEPILPSSTVGNGTEIAGNAQTNEPKHASAPTAAPVLATVKQKSPAGAKRQTAAQESGSIRVKTSKVDSLINLVGELVITQSMLSRFSGEFDFTQLGSLQEGLTQLARNTRELQETVMQIRMLPISFAFSRFSRLVHDLSSQLGKQVELKLSGQNTELDKTVLEKIGDPLVHLVRNALDHGLETPEVRRAAGKLETGEIELNAYHEGGSIIIEVIDDGAGINKARVLAKARERGLVGADEELEDERVNNLIFQPGFSTVEAVSDLSGRGVGMDVVQRNINDLGGQVRVASEEGVGSKFTIRLPLTLAILDGQLVRVGAETYIVPLVSIVETIKLLDDKVNAIAGKAELFKLRDEYLPVVRLYDLFGITPDHCELSSGLLVVVEANGERAGIFVDELQEQQQIVIKSLKTNFRQVQGLSGATILGDGTVALIVDVPGLLQLFFEKSQGAPPQVAAVA